MRRGPSGQMQFSRVVGGTGVGFTVEVGRGVAGEELAGGGVVVADPEILESGVGVGVLAGEPQQ